LISQYSAAHQTSLLSSSRSFSLDLSPRLSGLAACSCRRRVSLLRSVERGAERKSIVETFASLTKRQEAKIGTDGLQTSVPFFVVGHLSQHPLSSRNALIRDLVLALMSSILNQERRTWTRSVGTKNCSSPALSRTGPRSWTKVEGRLSARSYEGRTSLVLKNGVPIFRMFYSSPYFSNESPMMIEK